VLPVFIFDATILDPLPRADRRVSFLYDQIIRLHTELQALGSGLYVAYGTPEAVWADLLSRLPLRAIYTNRDYEPQAKARDTRVAALARQHGADFRTFKDHVLFEHAEVQTQSNGTYTVFTPYKKRWLERLTAFHVKAYPTLKYASALVHWPVPALGSPEIPGLGQLGFVRTAYDAVPPPVVPDTLLREYADRRNRPDIPGTSRMGCHLRFGTVSIRALARQAQGLSEVYLSELIWRDFYSQILDAFPQVATRALKPAYDGIAWRDSTADYDRWRTGTTGYPLVDAGIRELNATGFMHNRVRMVTASFLTKHLLLPWQWGERHFAEQLLDFDLASNNGGWQWASGSGCDAAPYFRIFNPTEQAKTWDPDGHYVRTWVPEVGTHRYPSPMVEHTFARKRALDTYKRGLETAQQEPPPPPAASLF
jgi:deoxyribodipyrimidine photo-lyase